MNKRFHHIISRLSYDHRAILLSVKHCTERAESLGHCCTIGWSGDFKSIEFNCLCCTAIYSLRKYLDGRWDKNNYTQKPLTLLDLPCLRLAERI